MDTPCIRFLLLGNSFGFFAVRFSILNSHFLILFDWLNANSKKQAASWITRRCLYTPKED